MALSIGRRIFNLATRRDGTAETVWPPRPAGPLVWCHAPGAESAGGLAELARRLIEEDGVAALMSGPAPHPAGALTTAMPKDTPREARAFLDHWRPDLLVTAEGEVRPALLFEAEERQIPVIACDARAPVMSKAREGWFPGLLRGAAQTVHQVFALDDSAARAWSKAGAPRVVAAGRLEDMTSLLPCHEGERAALATQLAARPVWLAVGVPEAEEDAVIAAHRAALRLTHRLLLILVPAAPERSEALAARLEETEGWLVARRAADEEPEAEVAVYLPGDDHELGLWYRLAPVTFLGGSLAGEGALRNPLEPAALGSAILHGPRPGAYGAVLGRLGAARGARAVGSAADLAQALPDVLAPDRAARLAQAAWTVATEGTEVTEQVLDCLRSLLEGRS